MFVKLCTSLVICCIRIEKSGNENSEKYFEDQINQLLFTNPSTNYTVIDGLGITRSNVYFIDNTDSLQFKLSGNYYTQDVGNLVRKTKAYESELETEIKQQRSVNS